MRLDFHTKRKRKRKTKTKKENKRKNNYAKTSRNIQ
jgi:hypothetical protein